MKVQHHFPTLISFLLLSLLVSACVPPPQTGASGAAQPTRQMIVVGLAEASTTLDPADHSSRYSETMIRNM